MKKSRFANLCEAMRARKFEKTYFFKQEIADCEQVLTSPLYNNVYLFQSRYHSGMKAVSWGLVDKMLHDETSGLFGKEMVLIKLADLMPLAYNDSSRLAVLDEMLEEVANYPPQKTIFVFDVDFDEDSNVAGERITFSKAQYGQIYNRRFYQIKFIEALQKLGFRLILRNQAKSYNDPASFLWIRGNFCEILRENMVFVHIQYIKEDEDIINFLQMREHFTEEGLAECLTWKNSSPLFRYGAPIYYFQRLIQNLALRFPNILWGKSEVDAVVALIFSEKIIPQNNLAEASDEKQVKAVANLEETLNAKVLGQKETVKAFAQKIQVGISPFRDPNRPIFSFLLSGTSGTGKTYLAKSIAAALDLKFLRVDMSEYKIFDFSRLIGSRNDLGILGKFLKDNPSSLILFDEADKTTIDNGTNRLLDFLLPVLDEGRLVLGDGSEVDVTKCGFILSANFATDLMFQEQIGFCDKNQHRITSGPLGIDQAKRMFSSYLRVEMINRFDAIAVFKALDKESLREILFQKVAELNETQEVFQVKLDEKLVDFIVERSFFPDLGARPLLKNFNELIRPVLLAQMEKIDNRDKKHQLNLTVLDGKAVVDYCEKELRNDY